MMMIMMMMIVQYYLQLSIQQFILPGVGMPVLQDIVATAAYSDSEGEVRNSKMVPWLVSKTPAGWWF